nr:MAG TPA: hypothetical protein [Caudoviricetes sp.]
MVVVVEPQRFAGAFLFGIIYLESASNSTGSGAFFYLFVL